MKATTQAKTEITAAAIYRCTNKATHEVFYMVKSDSSDAWYQVRFDTRSAAWTCQCPSKHPCKHERAVQEVLAIRRTRIAAEMGGDVPAIVATIQAEDDKRRAETFTALKTQYDVRAQASVVAEVEKVARQESTRRGAVADLVYRIEECEQERAAHYARLEEQRRTAQLNGNRAFSLLRR